MKSAIRVEVSRICFEVSDRSPRG